MLKNRILKFEIKNCITCYQCFYLLQVRIKTQNGKLSRKNRKTKQKLKNKSGYRKCDLTDYGLKTLILFVSADGRQLF